MRAIFLTNTHDAPMKAPKAKDVHGHDLAFAPKGSTPVDERAFHDAWVRAMLGRSVLLVDLDVSVRRCGGVATRRELAIEFATGLSKAGFSGADIESWIPDPGGVPKSGPSEAALAEAAAEARQAELEGQRLAAERAEAERLEAEAKAKADAEAAELAAREEAARVTAEEQARKDAEALAQLEAEEKARKNAETLAIAEEHARKDAELVAAQSEPVTDTPAEPVAEASVDPEPVTEPGADAPAADAPATDAPVAEPGADAPAADTPAKTTPSRKRGR